MVNLALLIGTGPFGEDSLYKMPWVRHLSKQHRVFVASRIEPAVHYVEDLRRIIGDHEYESIRNSIDEIRKLSYSFESIHEWGYSAERKDESEITRAQNLIEISFDFLLSLDPEMSKASAENEHIMKNRLLLAANLVSFFKDFYERNQIDVLVNTIEDDIVSSVAYFMAKRMNILIIGYVPGRFPRKGVMFARDYSDVCVWNRQQIAWPEIESMYNFDTISGGNVLERNRTHWDLVSVPIRFRGLSILHEYDKYVRLIRRRLPNECLIFRDFVGGNLWRASREYSMKFIRRRIVRSYFDEPPSPEDFFLFSMHYMIDSQITFREPFVDQIRLIESISRGLPTQHKLYVKPHPHYFGTDTGILELRRISRLSNVRIINPKTSPIPLIKKSKGVITINSTTGFEALIMGVPVITFGHDFYCVEKLCQVVRDMNDLPGILQRTTNGAAGNGVRRDAAIEFVKNVYLNTIWTNGKDYEYGFSGLTDDDGLKVASALNRILDSIDGEGLTCL
jgi:hypothetical protein